MEEARNKEAAPDWQRVLDQPANGMTSNGQILAKKDDFL
jgi:hypothetical protein